MKARVMMMTERFTPDIGGVARSASRTARRLAQLGHECEVFSWTKTLAPGELDSSLLDLGDCEILSHRLGLFANFDFSMQHTINVMEWLHKKDPIDLIWGHYLYPSGFVAVMLAKLLGIPSTVSARGNDVDRLMFPPGDFARLDWTLRNADRVTAVSGDLAKKIRTLASDVSPVVIRNTVDADLFKCETPDSQLRSSLGIYPNESVLGFCGELRHKKGLPFLLSALQDVRSQQPACLLVIGEVRAREQTTITEYLRDDLASVKRILVTGHLESQREVARHLNLCDVVLLPSVWDGLPNALLESMACKRVVIGSDAGGIPEALDHGETGFVIPKAELNRLGEAAVEVLGMDPEKARDIGEQARLAIVDRFHPKSERDSLSVLVDELISKNVE